VFFCGSIKVTTGFPIGDSSHNPFISRLTLRAPVSAQKKHTKEELSKRLGVAFIAFLIGQSGHRIFYLSALAGNKIYGESFLYRLRSFIW